MEATETTFTERYCIGFHYYPIVFADQPSPTHFGFLASIVYNVASIVTIFVLLVMYWSSKTMVIQGVAIVYALLLIVLLYCPLYFTFSRPTYEIPELIEKEQVRRSFQQRLNTLFFPILLFATWKVFHTDQSIEFQADNYPLYYATLIYTILGYVYVFHPIAIAMVAVIFLTIFFWNSRLQEQARLKAMGASQDLINSIPIFLFRTSTTPNPNPEQGDMPPIHVEMPARKKKQFKLIPWKVTERVEPVEPLYLELNPENANCSICISEYEQGDSLRQLPCKHHFHVSCIDEWLRINAKCPLCVQDIAKK
jgi:glycerol-3-phosphate acyltransferase PlsY